MNGKGDLQDKRPFLLRSHLWSLVKVCGDLHNLLLEKIPEQIQVNSITVDIRKSVDVDIIHA